MAAATTTRINAALRRLGREERLYRGTGYYYVGGGTLNVRTSGLYVFRLHPEDLQMAKEFVEETFAAAGEPIKLEL